MMIRVELVFPVAGQGHLISLRDNRWQYRHLFISAFWLEQGYLIRVGIANFNESNYTTFYFYLFCFIIYSTVVGPTLK